MTIVSRSTVLTNRYFDSVALLRLSAELEEIAGVEQATVVMATPANLERARERGIEAPTGTTPSDLFIGVLGTSEACENALAAAHERLAGPSSLAGGTATASAGASEAPVSLHQHIARGGRGDLALISVPGRFAAAEAAKAIDLGLHVMIFSDNVTIEDEVALKRSADARGLLVMGPDCGTAIVNGVPLGFANVVRRGPVAVVGASGTGMQEVVSRVHNLGSGISQAIGCGGRDISEAIGGVTMCRALEMIGDDPQTEVVVIVSKPPHRSVLSRVFESASRLRASGKTVIANFVGVTSDGAAATNTNTNTNTNTTRVADGGGAVVLVETLAAAADEAVRRLGSPRAVPDALAASSTDPSSSFPEMSAVTRRPTPGIVRGAFVGGTFCHEAGAVLAALGAAPSELELIDFGDDVYTDGRPHPMIDPSLRDDWVLAALDDPTTAVVLIDVVLGLGAHPDPAGRLLARLDTRGREMSDPSKMRQPPLIAHVCGTDLDPQNRNGVRARLVAAGVHVADSNAQATRWAADVLRATAPQVGVR